MGDQQDAVEILRKAISEKDIAAWRGKLKAHLRQVYNGEKPAHSWYEESLIRELKRKTAPGTSQDASATESTPSTEGADPWDASWDAEMDAWIESVRWLSQELDGLANRYLDRLLSGFAGKARLFAWRIPTLKHLSLSRMTLEIHPSSRCRVEHEGAVYSLEITARVAITGIVHMAFGDDEHETRKVYCRFQKTPCWQHVGVSLDSTGYFTS